MGQVLHGCATTTEAVRRAIQTASSGEPEDACQATRDQSQDGRQVEAPASVADLPTGPKDAGSTVLSVEEEAVIVAFRRHTLLPLDDLPLCASGDDSASDALVIASLLAAPWNLAAAPD
jgi:hypothetical protein